MITIGQVKRLRMGQSVYVKGKYNANGTPMRYKVNGVTQFWKTRPSDFKVPLQRGLYEHGYITRGNAHLFTLKAPAAREPVTKRVTAPREPQPHYPRTGYGR